LAGDRELPGAADRAVPAAFRADLLAGDLDGTLIAANGAPPPGVREALAALDAAGVPLVVCTGRPHIAATGMIAAAGLPVCMLASSYGGLVVDLRTGTCLRHLAVPHRLLDGLVERLRRHGLTTTAYAGTSAPVDVGHRGLDPDGLDVDDEGCGQVTRLIAVGDEDSVCAARAELIAAVPVEVRVEQPVRGRLDVRHRLATKGEALRFVARTLCVRLERTAAVGNDASDVEMLGVAGWGALVGDGAPPRGWTTPVVRPDDLAACLRALLPT
jgi:hydroxymethylpyrimidine pyrophosphatase-like HAD family hydrolase